MCVCMYEVQRIVERLKERKPVLADQKIQIYNIKNYERKALNVMSEVEFVHYIDKLRQLTMPP